MYTIEEFKPINELNEHACKDACYISNLYRFKICKPVILKKWD